MSIPCDQPIGLDKLAAYVLGELDAPDEAQVEEHYFDCSSCTERLSFLQSLSRDMAGVVRAGLLSSGVRPAWVERAERGGVRLRQYTLTRGEPVQCTVSPDDDFVIVRLRLDEPVAGELVVETEFQDLETDLRERRDLVSQFVASGDDELVYAFSGDLVRTFPKSRWIMHVCDADGRRTGPFTMNHTPDL